MRRMDYSPARKEVLPPSVLLTTTLFSHTEEETVLDDAVAVGPYFETWGGLPAASGAVFGSFSQTR